LSGIAATPSAPERQKGSVTFISGFVCACGCQTDSTQSGLETALSAGANWDIGMKLEKLRIYHWQGMP